MDFKQTAQDLAGKAKDKAGDMAHAGKDKFGDLKEKGKCSRWLEIASWGLN